MKRTLALLFWATNLLISNRSFAQLFMHTELIGRVSDVQATLQFQVTDTLSARVIYGLTPTLFSDSTPWVKILPGKPENILLTHLQPNSQIYYRLDYSYNNNPIIHRPVYSFHTQRPPNSTFTFTIQADPHMDEQSDSAVYLRCLKNQLEDNPDFMIDLGDILMSDKLRLPNKTVPRDTVTYRSHMMRKYYETVAHSLPVYIAIGNHEGESGWNLNGTANNVAIWGTVDRKKYFLNPENDGFFSSDTTQYPFVGTRESYFSYTWGDALFVILDPYWNTKVKPDSLNGWRWSLGKAQYDWLKSTLENSDAKFKFVFCHHLVGGDKDGRGGVEFASKYEWGGNNLDGTYGFTNNRPGWYKPIKELLKEHKVAIFFHGHDHFFGQQEKECLIYQEVPQPSHPNFTSINYAEGYGYHEGVILPNSGHLRVTVSPTETKVEYVRVYLPRNETPNRKNKDISAFYTVKANGCYDTLSAGSAVIWKADEFENLVYPNPAKNFIDFQLNIVKPEKYSISIFDNSGKLVKRLLDNEFLEPGEFITHWNGKSDTNESCAAGLYYYQTSTSTAVLQNGKIILTTNP